MRSSFYLLSKRTFDVCFSFLAITVTLPLWFVIALGIKFSSKGPIFYKAERVGMGNVVFTLYKFRSMHEYKPNKNIRGEQREGGYIANENRIFPFGQFLRRSKLDELPQFLNILKGEMSVVGSRPITVAGVKKHYIGKYDAVLSAQPGLTCLDSLYDYAHGELVVKNNDEFDRKIAPVRDYLASMYVKKRCIRLDIYCIMRTIKLVFEIAVLKKKKFTYTKYEREALKAVFSNSNVMN